MRNDFKLEGSKLAQFAFPTSPLASTQLPARLSPSTQLFRLIVFFASWKWTLSWLLSPHCSHDTQDKSKPVKSLTHCRRCPAKRFALSPNSIEREVSQSVSESPESNCSLEIQCRWFPVVIVHCQQGMKNQFTFLSLSLMLLLLESKKWFGRWYFWSCRTNQGIYFDTVLAYHMWWFYALFELLKCLVTWVDEFHIFHPLQYPQNNVFPWYWPCAIDQKCLYIWYERRESRSEGCMWEDAKDMIESVPDDQSLTFLRQYHWLFWRYECWPRKIEKAYMIYLISI